MRMHVCVARLLLFQNLERNISRWTSSIEAKKALRHEFRCEQSFALMQRKWNANLGKDGCLHMQYEHIHELAAVVHGYSLDSALIDEFRPKVTEETVCKCEALQQCGIAPLYSHPDSQGP